MAPASEIQWTNPSARSLAPHGDPVATVTAKARAVVYGAVEDGWEGPPYDPFELADQLRVQVVAVDDLDDARLVHAHGRPRIEFNPNRPVERVRFSVAHELAHTLFPDADAAVRYRAHGRRARKDDWQLELLCNLAAAEFLMPLGGFPHLEEESLDINHLLSLRKQFGVSPEALLRRVVEMTPEPAGVFAAARDQAGYRIDYAAGSRAWEPRVRRGERISASALSECTAVGYTARSDARWGEELHVECIGVPPYPGQRYPRVVGIARPKAAVPLAATIGYLHGDATEPRGEPPWIVAHVVNDKARTWGGRGFARALREAHPEAHDQYREWAASGVSLGDSHLADLGGGRHALSMVAQRGYGHASRPRLRYQALEQGLSELGRLAGEMEASVHTPLIGTGQAGGRWSAVKELLDSRVARKRVQVTVYVLPGAPLPEEADVQMAFDT